MLNHELPSLFPVSMLYWSYHNNWDLSIFPQITIWQSKPYDSKTETIQQGTDRHEISIALQNVRPRNVTLRLPITWEPQWLVVLHSSWTVGDSKIWFDSTAAVWSNIGLGTNNLFRKNYLLLVINQPEYLQLLELKWCFFKTNNSLQYVMLFRKTLVESEFYGFVLKKYKKKRVKDWGLEKYTKFDMIFFW